MNNLLFQPAQLPVKAAVPGPGDKHAVRGDTSPGGDAERSFEKTLQKARRRNVPDEQEQTLASETMPVQSTYAQNQAAQEANAQTHAQESNQATVQQGTPVTGAGTTPTLDMAALLPVLKGMTLTAVGQAVDQAVDQAVSPLVALNAAAPVEAALTAEQMAALAAQPSNVDGQPAVSMEETQPEQGDLEMAPEFTDVLKNLQKAAAKTELPEEKNAADDQPKLPQQPLSVETKQAETTAKADVKNQPEFETVSATKKEQPASKNAQSNTLVLEQAGGSRETVSTANIAEPARLAEARQVHILRQVADGVENMARSNQNTLRLQLHPENMGKIDLRMTMSKAGMLVTMLTDTQTTSSMLSQHLAELRTTLTEAGVTLAGLSVNSGNIGGQAFAQDQRQANYAQQQFGQPSSLATEKVADPREVVRLRDVDTNVEYLV